MSGAGKIIIDRWAALDEVGFFQPRWYIVAFRLWAWIETLTVVPKSQTAILYSNSKSVPTTESYVVDWCRMSTNKPDWSFVRPVNVPQSSSSGPNYSWKVQILKVTHWRWVNERKLYQGESSYTQFLITSPLINSRVTLRKMSVNTVARYDSEKGGKFGARFSQCSFLMSLILSWWRLSARPLLVRWTVFRLMSIKKMT